MSSLALSKDVLALRVAEGKCVRFAERGGTFLRKEAIPVGPDAVPLPSGKTRDGRGGSFLPQHAGDLIWGLICKKVPKAIVTCHLDVMFFLE